MAELSVDKKRILLVAAIVMLLGLVGAAIYKPKTYQEYVAKKSAAKNKPEQEQKLVSGPQAAVEKFLTLALSDNPTDALQLIENPGDKVSSVENIMEFLDIQIPLDFDYKIKDTTFNNTTGKVTVDIISSMGILEKDINLKNDGVQWKLTGVESKNNNQILFTDETNTLSIFLPQSMRIEATEMEVGSSYEMSDPDKTLQIAIFVTNQDLSEMLASLIDCGLGICANKNINGNLFNTFELYKDNLDEYAYTVRSEKNGVFYDIVGIASSKEDIEEFKTMVETIKLKT